MATGSREQRMGAWKQFMAGGDKDTGRNALEHAPKTVIILHFVTAIYQRLPSAACWGNTCIRVAFSAGSAEEVSRLPQLLQVELPLGRQRRELDARVALLELLKKLLQQRLRGQGKEGGACGSGTDTTFPEI